MSSRRFALAIGLMLVTLLAACAPLPSLPAPTTGVTAGVPATVASPAPVEAATSSLPVTPTLSAPITPTVAMTATLATPAEATAAPEVTAAAPLTPTVTTGKPLEGGPIPPVSTYRDEFAGFELDYPAAWSVVDIAPDIKQNSLSYSVTFMSWAPQEPGGQGMPEGGAKIDLTVTKGGAASPEAAVESRRQELAAEGAGSQITLEEPWDLQSGVRATHWTIQAANGDTIDELVAAINGNRVILSGLGGADFFESIAMTLRPVEPAPASAAVQTPAPEAQPAQPKESAGPVVSAEADASPAAAQPLTTTIYTVRRGDTLRSIAARFGVTIAAILGANPQIGNPDQIYVGQQITIPTGGGTNPPPAAGTTSVNIYMIGLEGGSVGCGDQVVPVRRDIPKTAAPLTAALNLLLAQKSQYYGESGLYNALYQSNLRVASITRSGSTWTVRLAGTLQLGGVCDNPRVKAQLEQTALQFSTVQAVRYFINGQPLEAVLSGK